MSSGQLRVQLMKGAICWDAANSRSLSTEGDVPALFRLPSRPGSCCAVIWFAYCGLFVA